MNQKIERYLIAMYGVTRQQIREANGRWTVDGENVGTNGELLDDIREMNTATRAVSGFSAGF